MLTDDKFMFDVKQENNENIVLLHGVIDEDTVFDDIQAIDSPIVLNFKNITSINSCGIRGSHDLSATAISGRLNRS